MVSFSCEICSDIFKKPKLDSHALRCRGAYYTCIDCSKTFVEGQWKDHTSCISEAEKYQGNSYKPEKGKGKSGKRSENSATIENTTVTTTVPMVKEVEIPILKVPDAEAKQPKKDKKDKKDKKRKGGSLEAISTPVAEVDQTEAKDIPMADAPDQPGPSKKEKKKERKEKREKRDKKDKKKSKDTSVTSENNPDSAPATGAVDNKKRKSVSAEDTPAKRKKGEEEKARVSQERLAELVGEEELGLEEFLERLGEEVGCPHDKLTEGDAFKGLLVKADGGKAVLSFKG